MAPIQGWYPDPAGSGQLRFWDGEKWTTATGPVPRAREPEPTVPAPAMPYQAMPYPAMAGAGIGVAAGTPYAPLQPPGQSYGAPSAPYAPVGGYGRPGSGVPAWAPKPQRFGKRARILIAAVLAVGVAAAVTVPLAMHSGKSALTQAFDRSLLSSTTVSAIAGETFTIDTSKDNSSGGNSDSGCMDAANTLTNAPQDKGNASRSFVSADHTGFLEEDLSSNPTNAQQLDTLRNTLKTCRSATFDGSAVTLALLPAPAVEGSDDTLAMLMSGEVSGTQIAVEFAVARFGDNIVGISMATNDPSSGALTGLTDSLLTEAALTARPAFGKTSTGHAA